MNQHGYVVASKNIRTIIFIIFQEFTNEAHPGENSGVGHNNRNTVA